VSSRYPHADVRQQARRFWTFVGLVCVVGGGASYYAGRHWVGGLLGGVKVEAKSVKLPSDKGASEASAANTEAERQKPPDTATVTVQDREATEGEKSEIEAEKVAGQASSQKPDTAAATPSHPPADTTQATDGGKYLVVAGSFVERSNADRSADELSRKGYHPFITEYTKDGVTYRRVNVAAFRERDAADDLVRKLSKEGVSARVGAP
jgi:cell division protein FtsN